MIINKSFCAYIVGWLFRNEYTCIRALYHLFVLFACSGIFKFGYKYVYMNNVHSIT